MIISIVIIVIGIIKSIRI